MPRVARWLLLVAALVALAAALAFAFGTVVARPLDTVEGELLFEAQRLRDRLPLYVDPAVGAFDYGPMPSRYFVLYTPLWPELLAQAPARWAATMTRLASTVAWFGLLALIAVRAPAERRFAAVVAAAWAGGTFMLVRHASNARADTVAVVIAAAGVLRSVQRGRVDGVSGALFAFAAWMKPNVVGLAAGALLHEGAVGRWRVAKPLGAALAVSLAFGWWTHALSHGLWLDHLAHSTMQSMSAGRGLEQVISRLPFLGLPHAFAWACAWRSRADPRVRLLLTVLGASLVWAVAGMAKVGSATGYWLEPSVAAVMVIAYAPVVPVTRAMGAPVALAVSMVAAVVLGLSAAASVRAFGEALAERDAIARVRSTCGAASADLVLGEHPGLEMMLDGRVLETPYQMTHLVRAGRYPAPLWQKDILLPQVRCLVTESDVVERPLSQVDLEEDRFAVEIRATLRDKFELVMRDGPLWIYRARSKI
jgi:hypothetical protein